MQQEGAGAQASPWLGIIQALAPLLMGQAITQSTNPHAPGFVARSALEAQCATAFFAADVSKNGLIDWKELRLALQTGFAQYRECMGRRAVSAQSRRALFLTRHSPCAFFFAAGDLWTRNLAQQMLRAFDSDGNSECLACGVCVHVVLLVHNVAASVVGVWACFCEPPWLLLAC